MKLFVWEGAVRDYWPGIMFALAESVEDARRLILEKAVGIDMVEKDLKKNPKVYDEEVGFYVLGAG